MADEVKDRLTRDHAELYDTAVARRYFAKFARITGHLARVAAELEGEGRLTRTEARLLGRYLAGLTATFRALGHKYLMTGRAEGAPRLTIDRHDSGFPVAQELMVMALDAAQAARHLTGLPSADELRDRMIRQIVGEQVLPTALQFAMSQRLYFEALAAGGLFLARMDPDAQWLGEEGGRRHYLVHWAVYDAQTNLPTVWLMDVQDSGRTPLPNDPDRWPRAQAALMAQSLAGLKLLTVAQGFDTDFDTLHPRRLRRITLGPMHSHAFTLQSGPLARVLHDARAPEGEDWALVWTVEDLRADREEEVKSGWFSSTRRQIWALDPVAGAETGASAVERMVVLPERLFQVMAEADPPGLRGLRKFVVGAGGRILPMR